MDDFLDEELAVADPGGGFGAVQAGTAFALAGYLLDRQADKINAGGGGDVHVHVHTDDEGPAPVLVNALDGVTNTVNWDRYVGQEPLKQQLQVHITSAKARGKALDHILLASGMPGVGKTTMARLIAKEMGVYIHMLVPPFHRKTLHEAACLLSDGEILFIDEIHKLADHGPRAAEDLLHMLEERRIYTDSGIVELADITVIGATTEPDKLPETILDRFPIKPFFQPYTMVDLAAIAWRFVRDMGLDEIPMDLAFAIAFASRGTPRVVREFTVALRDLRIALGREPTKEELLAFKETDGNGMTRTHKLYLTTMYENFRRVTNDGEVQYVAGEYAMMSVLRETKPGLARIERFLMELNLLERTPSGRRLTDRGIAYARDVLLNG